MSAIDLRDRLRGSLLGLAVCDAVGTTVEFMPPGSFDPVTDMTGGGKFSLLPGQVRRLAMSVHFRNSSFHICDYSVKTHSCSGQMIPAWPCVWLRAWLSVRGSTQWTRASDTGDGTRYVQALILQTIAVSIVYICSSCNNHHLRLML